jgi:hypothetical protein
MVKRSKQPNYSTQLQRNRNAIRRSSTRVPKRFDWPGDLENRNHKAEENEIADKCIQQLWSKLH